MPELTKPSTKAIGYMKAFSCIGPQCEDTCCSGWHIQLAGGDFSRIREYLNAKKRGQDFENFVVFEPEGQENNGRFNFGWEGACPILDEGFCALHRDRGEAAIPTLCATFPRNILQINQQTELHGQFSCPEVVRLCLLHPDPLEMSPIGLEQLPQRYESSLFSDSSYYHRGLVLAQNYVREIQNLSDLSLFQKNMALISFCKRISSFCYQDCPQDPCPKLEKMIVTLLRNRPSYTPGERPEWSDLILELVTSLPGLRARSCKNLRFQALCRNIYGSYAAAGELLLAGRVISAELRQRLWQVFLLRRQQANRLFGGFLEERLARFCGAFWLQDLYVALPSPAEAAHTLAFSLAVIRFMLFSHPTLLNRLQQGHPQQVQEPLLDEALVEVIQIFSKYLGSDSALMERVSSALGSAGLHTVANLSHLLEI